MAKKKKFLDRTIAKELHDQWIRLKRRGDSQKIADELEYSKPTIDKALIYGFVVQQDVIDGINKFFAERLNKEREQAEDLKNLTASASTVRQPIAFVKMT